MQPIISIITVNFNGLELTIDLLKSIERQSYKNVEVFVVDNGSKEDPSSIISKEFPTIKCIRSEKNLGFAGGNNLAVPQAQGDFLFFVNNDAEITEGALQKLVDLFEKHPKIGIASPLLCYFNESQAQGKDLIQFAGATLVHPMTARNKTIGEKQWDNGQFKTAQPTAYAHGAAMLLRRETIEKIGVMFEDFFLYYEELDWCERIRKAGYDIWIEPNARIYHKESATVQKISGLKTYYLNRNRIYFMRRNFSGFNLFLFSFFLVFVTIPKNVLMFLLRGEFGQVKVFLKAVWWNVTDWFSNIYNKNYPAEKYQLSDPFKASDN